VAGFATLNKGVVAPYVVLLGAWIVLAGPDGRWPTRLKMLLLAGMVDFGFLFQRSLCNEFECPLDGGVLAVPGWGSGSGFRTAP
jgi:hypothetical protein